MTDAAAKLNQPVDRSAVTAAGHTFLALLAATEPNDVKQDQGLAEVAIAVRDELIPLTTYTVTLRSTTRALETIVDVVGRELADWTSGGLRADSELHDALTQLAKQISALQDAENAAPAPSPLPRDPCHDFKPAGQCPAPGDLGDAQASVVSDPRPDEPPWSR